MLMFDRKKIFEISNAAITNFHVNFAKFFLMFFFSQNCIKKIIL